MPAGGNDMSDLSINDLSVHQTEKLGSHQKLCHGHSFGTALSAFRKKDIAGQCTAFLCSTMSPLIAYLTSSSLDTSKLFDSE